MDVSRMYRAVLLPENQRDLLYIGLCGEDAGQPLQDYRMTRLTLAFPRHHLQQ